MDPDAVKSTLSNLAFGNVLAAAARDYKKEVLANEKAQSSNPANEEVDLDELMDDPELEKLHADRIAALKREVEKREAFKRQGHGEYRENAPFFVTKLAIKTLPCVLLFSKGIAIDRLVGFQDLGTKDDFTTTKLENVLIKKVLEDLTNAQQKKVEDDEDAEYQESIRRSVRAGCIINGYGAGR
ncbi:hypothetical protein Bca52824_077040 [Brassica carinata]|uniref:Uncharacterized protein n=1 Tax=Brassica carinata TaxID=52824 RepID=A0A8X7TY63_BRACI|nr:hypothetical protein Bca52824_077040 [Brassica carinata]